MMTNLTRSTTLIIYLLCIVSASAWASDPSAALGGAPWQSPCVEQQVQTGPGQPAIPGIAAKIFGIAWFRFGPRPDDEIPPTQTDPDPADRLESFAWAYDDDQCTKELAEVHVNGSFAMPSESSGSVRVGTPEGAPLDLVTGQVTMMPLASKVAIALSLARTCGHGDWKVGKAKDVTGCKDLSMPAAGDVHYDIFGLGETDETLRFGRLDGEHDGGSAEHRPEKLGDSIFTRAETKGGGLIRFSARVNTR